MIIFTWYTMYNAKKITGLRIFYHKFSKEFVMWNCMLNPSFYIFFSLFLCPFFHIPLQFLTQPRKYQVQLFNPTRGISGSIICLTQPREYQVQLFNPTRRISGSVIQPNPETTRFSYSTQPRINHFQLFILTHRISGSVIQPNPQNIRFSYSTQPRGYQVQLFYPTKGNIRFSYSTQPRE